MNHNISISAPILLIPPLQHQRNPRRHSLMNSRRRMERIMPEIFLQRKLTVLIESSLIPLLPILTANIQRVLIDRRLGVGFRVVHDLVDESVGVELEDCDVRVLEAEVGRECSETDVPG